MLICGACGKTRTMRLGKNRKGASGAGFALRIEVDGLWGG